MLHLQTLHFLTSFIHSFLSDVFINLFSKAVPSPLTAWCREMLIGLAQGPLDSELRVWWMFYKFDGYSTAPPCFFFCLVLWAFAISFEREQQKQKNEGFQELPIFSVPFSWTLGFCDFKDTSLEGSDLVLPFSGFSFIALPRNWDSWLTRNSLVLDTLSSKFDSN